MTLDKIVIKNFKSIQDLELDINKYGDSYTRMLLGINEVGKSNILQAISFLKTPTDEFDFTLMRNQKDEKSKYIDLYFYLSFESKTSYLDYIKPNIKNGELLDFEITNIEKNVYLSKTEKNFEEVYSFTVENVTKKLYIKKNPASQEHTFEISEKDDPENDFLELTDNLINEYFTEDITSAIRDYEPSVSFWKPSDKYLISSVDLKSFKENPYTNMPLRNIFILSGYKTMGEIKEKIEETTSAQLRQRLMKILSTKTTKYIKSIWNHKISVVIEITDSMLCNVSIQDDGTKNEYNYFKMSDRSEGFKQFMSLILSLSVETKKLDRKHKLILIDEPENHLHPSGIRDLGKELLEIGKKNYLFVSTHSPFLIDRDNKERNIIIKKDASANTIKKEITNEDDIRDDEVLSEAFGINVYRDLLITHKILVEGGSDKLILQKTFKLKKLDYGITNGTGSNIVQIASRLDYDDIKVMVITDDDDDGRKYRDEIIKIDGVFSSENVFTIRDLVGTLTNKGTIEDLLGKEFIQSKFNAFYKDQFGVDSDLELTDTPFIEQVKIYLLKKQSLNKLQLKESLDTFKKKVSEEFKPSSQTVLDTKFPLLKELIEKIKEKIN